MFNMIFAKWSSNVFLEYDTGLSVGLGINAHVYFIW
jgi:hypothetical protein